MFIVAIKRRYWFGYRTFKAVRFFLRGFTKLYAADGTEFEGPITPHLVIELADGTEHYVSDIEHRDWFTREVK